MNIKKFKKKVLKSFNKSKNIQELENNKIKYLKKINKFIKKIKFLSIKKKKKFGKIINNTKKDILKYLNKKRKFFLNYILNKNKIDITLPGRYKRIGSIHPITISSNKIKNIFNSIGFKFIEGPEIESECINFIALNSPKNHPARSMQDTFYINKYDNFNKPLLLRTHTSSVQIRYASLHKPPIKIFTIGKVYRLDNDSIHTPMFHQLELLWIDKNINFSHLKGLYLNFIKTFFNNKNLKIKFRPSYFPFTEPSAEIDLYLKKKWIEVSGAGQIHPTVMKNINIDNKKFSGFAFGSGIERLTMLYYKIKDIRLFYKNNLNFLKQFY